MPTLMISMIMNGFRNVNIRKAFSDISDMEQSQIVVYCSKFCLIRFSINAPFKYMREVDTTIVYTMRRKISSDKSEGERKLQEKKTEEKLEMSPKNVTVDAKTEWSSFHETNASFHCESPVDFTFEI